MYGRRVVPSPLVFSLSSHRHSYVTSVWLSLYWFIKKLLFLLVATRRWSISVGGDWYPLSSTTQPPSSGVHREGRGRFQCWSCRHPTANSLTHQVIQNWLRFKTSTRPLRTPVALNSFTSHVTSSRDHCRRLRMSCGDGCPWVSGRGCPATYPLVFLGVIRSHRRDETWPGSIW